jgi:hypothetical protein
MAVFRFYSGDLQRRKAALRLRQNLSGRECNSMFVQQGAELISIRHSSVMFSLSADIQGDLFQVGRTYAE